MSRTTISLALIAVIALVLAACTAPSATPAQTAAGGGESVDVSLTEYSIDMPDSIPAGHVTFNISNDGSETHAFEVEGNGMEEETEELAPGGSDTLEVDLEPGTYEVYCPVDDHRGMGMEVELEVTES